MGQLVCPACRKKLPDGGVNRCPECGAKLAGRKPSPGAGGERVDGPDSERAPGPRPRKRRRRKAEKTGLSEKQLIGLFVGGGLLASVLLIGGLVFLLRRGGPGGPGGGGQYAVVDSLPSPPAEP